MDFIYIYFKSPIPTPTLFQLLPFIGMQSITEESNASAFFLEKYAFGCTIGECSYDLLSTILIRLQHMKIPWADPQLIYTEENQ